jgi:hypothetical protein
VDRIGNGTYDVAAASYGKPLLLYEMTDAMRGEIRDIAEQVHAGCHIRVAWWRHD